MYKAYILDRLLRKLISIIYRFLLFNYAALVCLINRNVFGWYCYVLAFLFYILIIYFLYKKGKWRNILRSLIDFILITFVLFQKELTIVNFLIILIPIFNAPNHSGEKRSFFQYIFAIGSIFFLQKYSINLLLLFPFLVFFIIDRTQLVRYRLARFTSYLYETIDEFYIDSFNLNQSHLLYRKIIEKLNSSKFRSLFTTDSILCFLKKDSDLMVVNGSFFVWTYEFNLDEADFENLRKRSLYDKPYTVNSTVYTKNHFILVKRKEEEYIYILNYSKPGFVSFLSPLYIKILLLPLLSKVAETLYVEREIRFALESNIRKIKDKIVFVNNATLAMHFLRNKFSPILGYFDTLNLYENEEEGSKKIGLKTFLDKSRVKVDQSIKSILVKTNSILEKSDNPFLITTFSDFSLQKIFNLTRQIWIEFFDIKKIYFNWQVGKDNTLIFSLNETYLEILFTDIIGNMHTYNVGQVQLNFVETDAHYIIKFINNVAENKVQESQKICKDFMSEDVTEIERRTTHGLTMIKSFLKQMKLEYNFSILDKIISFDIYFKKH